MIYCKGFERNTKSDLVYYTVPAFSSLGAKHMYTTRLGGVSEGKYASLNFYFGADELRSNVIENINIALEPLGFNASGMVATKQVHRDMVTAVTEKDAGKGPLIPTGWESDALITASKVIVLSGFYADCAVLLFFDPKRQAVGVAHAGWKGTALDIAGKTVDKMGNVFGCLPEDILCAVGPAICRECFETDCNVPDAIRTAFGSSVDRYIEKRRNKWHVDLPEINAYLLVSRGVKPENITLSGICTMCGSKGEFWSHRATKGVRGVHAAFIGL